MEKKNQDIFNTFLVKAEKRLEAKKVQRTCLVKLPSFGEVVRLRGLSASEVAETMDADTSTDSFAGDRYSVYLSMVEPDLKELAKKLKEEGKITEYLEVTEIFEIYEIRQMAEQIMELSGIRVLRTTTLPSEQTVKVEAYCESAAEGMVIFTVTMTFFSSWKTLKPVTSASLTASCHFASWEVLTSLSVTARNRFGRTG